MEVTRADITAIGEKYMAENENAIAAELTYGSNVKEVTTAVSEGTVDCFSRETHRIRRFPMDWYPLLNSLRIAAISAVVQRVVRDLHATVVLLRPVNGGEEVMLRAILPEGVAAAAGETVRFDLLAEKCLCCG